MKRRTHAQISRDIQMSEHNLSLAIGDYEYLQNACANFPAVIERLSKQVERLKEEESRFKTAPRSRQMRWRYAGEVPHEVQLLSSSKLLQIVADGAVGPTE